MSKKTRRQLDAALTWFETIDEMQLVLDAYLVEYNTKRPHQGRPFPIGVAQATAVWL